MMADRFRAGLLAGMGLALAVHGGIALSRYLEHVSSALEDRIGLYKGLAACMSLKDAPEEVQYHCGELWERYNRLASGVRD